MRTLLLKKIIQNDDTVTHTSMSAGIQGENQYSATHTANTYTMPEK
ncbi:hypothetical protein [Virgibacillus sp. SK37]|nr:hypothetical protein [Virgibacillus sp. SK37]